MMAGIVTMVGIKHLMARYLPPHCLPQIPKKKLQHFLDII